MRVCTRCGNLATGRQRYCTRCVTPLDPPVDPFGLPGNRPEVPGPGTVVLPVHPSDRRPVSPPPVSPPPVSQRPVLPRPASPRPASPRPVLPRPASPRQIFVPDVERRQWDIRALRAGDYDDLFAGGEAETGVLPPLVIDDPLTGDEDGLGDPGDRARGYDEDGLGDPGDRAQGYWDDGDSGGRGYRGGGHGGRHGASSRLMYPAGGGRRHAAGHRRGQIAGAVLGTLLVLAGLLTAWAAVSRHGGLGGSGTRLSSSQTSAPRGRAHPAAGPGHPGTGGSPRPAPTPAASAAPPAAATPATVTLAPGMGQDPAAGPVQSLLVSYFTAINAHRFSQYAQSFLPPERHQLSAATFAAGYGSTTDTGITLVSITAASPGLAATASFTSTQRSAPGATVTSCTDWDITLFLGRHGPGYLIGAPPPSYHAYHHACD